jgi:hypothetical protein
MEADHRSDVSATACEFQNTLAAQAIADRRNAIRDNRFVLAQQFEPGENARTQRPSIAPDRSNERADGLLILAVGFIAINVDRKRHIAFSSKPDCDRRDMTAQSKRGWNHQHRWVWPGPGRTVQLPLEVEGLELTGDRLEIHCVVHAGHTPPTAVSVAPRFAATALYTLSNFMVS